MRTLLTRRVLASIPLLIAVTFLTKALLVLSPGNYLDALYANPAIGPDHIERLSKMWHLDSHNVFERYWYWLWPALQGDFGESFSKSASVLSLITERVLNTLLLTGSALVVSWLVAIPLGALAAVYRGRWMDRVIGMFSFLGLSIPTVFFSLLMVLFAARTGLFPAGGIHDQRMWDVMTPWQRFVDTLWHLVLPTIVLGTVGLAQYVRQMRGEMIDVLSRDYIRTARAKGLSRFQVVARHAVANALNPLVTLFGFSLAYLLAGALLTEYVFSWPGLGTLIYDALRDKDEPVVMAATVMLVLMLVVGNLIADVLLAVLDPRIRLE
ncbi:MAG TPA: ABC transporter permease [Blastocatellia bacterium]|nr:ABC transporter permease [Blastocatellia bacterium]